MPQLDTVSFFSQFFWFILFYLVFYIYILKYLLPNLARLYKFRTVQQQNGTVGVDGAGFSNNPSFFNAPVISSFVNFQGLNSLVYLLIEGRAYSSRFMSSHVDGIFPILGICIFRELAMVFLFRRKRVTKKSKNKKRRG